MKNKILLGLTFIFVIAIVVIILIFGKDKSEERSQEIDKVESTNSNVYVRKIWAAGQFYPENPEELKNKLEELINNTGILPKEGKLRILVVPHAGLNYSGQTAAWGFAQIKDKNYSKVIIISSDHKNSINYTAVMDSGEWETPLGNIQIDQDLASKLLSEKYKILSDAKEHDGQHVIEIETIFLKYLLRDFKMVPILLGANVSEETIKNLAFSISKNIDDNTLLVISSDLSHYPNYEDAKISDKNIIDGFLTLSPQKLEEASLQNQQKNFANHLTSACGLKAMELAQYAANFIGISDFSEINYSNSGDSSTDKGRVVGYGAIGGWSNSLSPIKLNENAQKEALILARNTISDFLNGEQKIDYKPDEDLLNYPMGSFVTLRENGNLRGCIGDFEPVDPLSQVIQNTSILSASKDTRFTPITKDELLKIKIEISVLSPLKKIGSWRDIIIGKNGVKIEKGAKSGTFLPQVATEQNWDLVTFLENLCVQKISLPANCYQDKDAQIYTYEAQIFEEEN